MIDVRPPAVGCFAPGGGSSFLFMDGMLPSCFFVCIQLERNAMSDIYDRLGSDELLVPNISTAIISDVIPGSKNSSLVILFSHPEDIANKTMAYEKIGFNYSANAVFTVRSNSGPSKAYNIGKYRLISLLEALEVPEEEIDQIIRARRDDQVSMLQRFVGMAVTSNYMSGRVKGSDGVIRVNFKFPDLDWEDIQGSLDDAKNSFVPAHDEELGDVVAREANRKALTRPDNAVVPMSMMDGDEFV